MLLRTATIALATIALAGAARAQDSDNPVHWTATPATETVARGGKTSVKLAATIEEGWHIYSLTQPPGGPFPTKITVPDHQPFSLAGTVQQSPPDAKFDAVFGIQVETYKHAATFTVPIKVGKAAKPGAQKLQVAARYEACNATMCLPPQTAQVTVGLNVNGGQ